MIRVGFILGYIDASWTGGVNYFKNLLAAVLSLPIRKIDPIIFLGQSTDFDLTGVNGVQVVCSKVFDRFHPLWLLRRANSYLYQRDLLVEKLLRQHKVDLLSHSGHLGRSTAIPSVGWIPDFQHMRKPDFFSPRAIRQRNRHFKELCIYCRRIIVSSQDAFNDLNRFYTQAQKKCDVLQFMSCLTGVDKFPSRAVLEKKYKFEGVYFHLPNHFWIHKNHQVVLKALGVLQRKGNKVQVLLTGNTVDWRREDYAQSIFATAQEMGLSHQFKLLGAIPYEEMIGIMLHSVAVINPSFFEGWSTTVEEARSLGKQIILSDIPVHREQNPPRAWFFDPTDAKSLASIMERINLSYTYANEAIFIKQSLDQLPARKIKFGSQFQDVLLRSLY